MDLFPLLLYFPLKQNQLNLQNRHIPFPITALSPLSLLLHPTTTPKTLSHSAITKSEQIFRTLNPKVGRKKSVERGVRIHKPEILAIRS